MATGEFVNAARTLEIEANTIVSGLIDVAGHLILTKFDGTEIDAGSVMGGFSLGTTATAGMLELATDVETIAGTDTDRAVTPFALAALTATETRKGLVELATAAEAINQTVVDKALTPAGAYEVWNTLQDYDPDLSAIAALNPANDAIIQRKSGVWSSRTMAELATDLEATGQFPDMRLYSGSSYSDVDGAHVFVGPVDPGAVANGSVWFDTTGT